MASAISPTSTPHPPIRMFDVVGSAAHCAYEGTPISASNSTCAAIHTTIVVTTTRLWSGRGSVGGTVERGAGSGPASGAESDTRGIVQSTQRFQTGLLELVAVEEVVRVERDEPTVRVNDVNARLLHR